MMKTTLSKCLQFAYYISGIVLFVVSLVAEWANLNSVLFIKSWIDI